MVKKFLAFTSSLLFSGVFCFAGTPGINRKPPATSRAYDLVVGPNGASGVDIADSSKAGLVAALTRLNRQNDTFSPSGPLKVIFYKSGIYDITDATTPAGIKIYAIPGSSTVWRNTTTGSGIVTNYGEIDGITFDGGGRSFTSRQIEMKSGSILRNYGILGMKNQTSASASRTCVMCVEKSSAVLITDGKYLDNATQVSNNGADQPYQLPFSITNSTNVFIQNLFINSFDVVGINNNFIGTKMSNSVFIRNSVFLHSGGTLIIIGQGSTNINITGNYFGIDFAPDSVAGYIALFMDSNSNAPFKISSCTISNNMFVVNSNVASPLIQLRHNQANGVIANTSIINNTVTPTVSNTCVFSNIMNPTGGKDATKNTLVAHNNVNGGSFSSEVSPVAWIYSDNYFNGVLATGTAIALSMSTITFTITDDGIPRTQINAPLELLSSTAPLGVVSTMTVVFSSRTYLYVVFYGSNNATPGGDIFVRFNNDVSPQYFITRATGTGSSVILNITSNSAVGLPIFGATDSTSTLRTMTMNIIGNEVGQPKIGDAYATSLDTGSATGMKWSDTHWSWADMSAAITRIDIMFAQNNVPFSGGAKWRVGSRIHVYGRND